MLRIKRMQFVIIACAFCLFAAAGGSALAQTDPIRVGFLTVKTGPFAALGKQLEEGFVSFLKERNYVLSGRKIELLVADTGGVPAAAKTRAQELVDRSKVHVLVGPLSTPEVLAIDDYVRQAGIPLIVSSTVAEDITQRILNPWLVRATSSAGQMTHALGDYAAKTLRYKRVATIASDFAYGHEVVGAFQRIFEENGGKVVQKLWVPLNVTDFASYVAQIKNVDAVYASFSGSNALGFVRQYNEFGLKGRLPLLASATTVDESFLKNMGEAAVGIVSSGFYQASLDTPENRRFVQAYSKEYGNDPGFYAIGGYTAGLMFEEALRAVNGRVEDRPALMKALRAMKLATSPRGELSLDAYGNPIGNVYIRKVQRKDGNLQNAVVQVYPKQSQFWTYDAKQFLANPVYSRDWPPARNLEQ